MRFDASAIEEEDWAARQKRSLISELSLESLLHDVDVSQAATVQPAGLYALPLLARPFCSESSDPISAITSCL